MTVIAHSPITVMACKGCGVGRVAGGACLECGAEGTVAVEYVRADQLAGAVPANDDAAKLAAFVRFLLQDTKAPASIAPILERYPAKEPVVRPAKRRREP